jgi:GMP synthase (glutamine-hydrolysing)
MRIHYMQHIPIENPGIILDWAERSGHTLTATHLYRGDSLPEDIEVIDWLVVMGGPMNIFQHRDHPWLPAEKRFIGETIAADKTVLGICLGAQLIADVLEARVFQNPEIEVGWFPVELDPDAFDGLPETVTPLHWHGDTFEIPPGARPLGRSAACGNQGFVFGDRVVGLQFHLEVNEALVETFIQEFASKLEPTPFVQTPDEILSGSVINLPAANDAMERLLDSLARVGSQRK